MPTTTSHPHAKRNEAIVYSHAILGCLVWAFIVPVGGILFRLNIKSRWIYRTHAILQITALLAYIAAVGLGVWMCENFSTKYYNMWDDPHVQLGLAILVLAFFLPPLGYVHHLIYKKAVAAEAAGLSTKRPGRTWFGTVHLWTGRALIVLGMVNGGLGIRMARKSPYQKWHTLRKAAIGYGVGCGVIAIIYCAIVIPWEVRRHRQERQGPNATTRQARRDLHSQKHSEKVVSPMSSGDTSPIDTESEIFGRDEMGSKTLDR